jgi:hypothetical protein
VATAIVVAAIVMVTAMVIAAIVTVTVMAMAVAIASATAANTAGAGVATARVGPARKPVAIRPGTRTARRRFSLAEISPAPRTP